MPVDGKISNASCAILVGGESKRMRALSNDKSKAKIFGKALLEHVYTEVAKCFDDVMVSAHEAGYESVLGSKARIIADTLPGRGPSLGVCEALKDAKNEWVFISACDHPFVSTELIEFLASQRSGVDCVVPEVKGGIEPLFAFYSKKCLAPLTKRVTEGTDTGLTSFIKNCTDINAAIVKEDELKKYDSALMSFLDVDTPEELAEAERKYKKD